MENYDGLSDEKLMTLYYNGDKEALNQLLDKRRYRSWLVVVFRKFEWIRYPDDAAHETCIKVMMTKVTGRGCFDEAKGKFKPWLHKIAANVARDIGRKEKPDQFHKYETEEGEESSEEDPLPSPINSPEVDFLWNEYAKAALECFLELESHQQTVVAARALGLKFKDLQTILGWAMGKIANTESLGLARFQESLAKRGYPIVADVSKKDLLDYIDRLIMDFGHEA
jgi:DNA-directed RNA polymerase specialized sigma24 family protein